MVGKIEFDKHVVMSVVGGGADQLLFRSTGDKLQVDKDNLLIGTYLALSADATLKKNTQLDGAISLTHSRWRMVCKSPMPARFRSSQL